MFLEIMSLKRGSFVRVSSKERRTEEKELLGNIVTLGLWEVG